VTMRLSSTVMDGHLKFFQEDSVRNRRLSVGRQYYTMSYTSPRYVRNVASARGVINTVTTTSRPTSFNRKWPATLHTEWLKNKAEHFSVILNLYGADKSHHREIYRVRQKVARESFSLVSQQTFSI